MIDNDNVKSDNRSKDDKNEDYEIWDYSDKKPLTIKDCKHNFVLDGDEIGDYVAWKCIICKRGTFIRKGSKIINSQLRANTLNERQVCKKKM